jgi:hypothetical protein
MRMRQRMHGLPLVVLGGIFLLFQALVVGLGPGMLVCLDPACPVVIASVSDGCCGADCDGEGAAAPAEQDCGCAWMPISDREHAEFAVSSPAPALVATVPPILLPLASTPLRSGARPPITRPSPHLATLRSIVLTC